MTMAKRGKRKNKKPFVFKDFETVLALPERLAEFLRLLLKLDKATWSFALDKIRQGAAYREWSKSKGPGKGRRDFAAPCAELKAVQRAIKQQMLDVIPIHFTRYGCSTGVGIKENAAAHVVPGVSVCVKEFDIMNAFPTVLRSRIRKVLQKPFRFLLDQFAGMEFGDDDVKLMLESIVDLVCLHDRLPQGPPTSPRLFGIVAYRLDCALFRFLHENSTEFQSYKMTSWFDDVSISSRDEIPEEVGVKAAKIIEEHGFTAHHRKDKSKYYSPATGTVPVITGLVLCADGHLTMTPNKVNQLRAALHKWSGEKSWDEATLGQINGTLGCIKQVYGDKPPSKLRKSVREIEARLAMMKIEKLQADVARARVMPKKKSKKK